MKSRILLQVAAVYLLSFVQAAMAEIKTEEISYTVQGVSMKGYLAYDDKTKDKRPGVLVVHEWWGHNDYARMRARKLAKLGYTAFAVDMYGNGKQAGHPEDASKFSREIASNMPLATARFNAALDLLKAHGSTDAGKMAAIGYCFGGGVVLQMARSGIDLDGVASFHGSLATQTPAKKGKVKASVFVANGADDPFVKPEQIQAFKSEMVDAGVDFVFVSYPDAKHAFTNPDADKYGEKFKLPLKYNKQADKKSWRQMKAFLKRIFK